ncbi:MAG: histidine phosphatase family protein [Chloroflexota bacterium]
MSEVTKIILIRHGQTEWNLIGRWQGFADIPLNETGQAQAEALQTRLAAWQIDAFVSSDLKRANETAVIAAKPHNLTVKTDPIWRERDVGDFSGLNRQQVKEKFPEIWGKAINGILEPPNGEQYQDLQKRALNALRSVIDSNAGSIVAVVTHGQLIHVLLAQIMGIEQGKYGRFSMRGNTGISIIENLKDNPIVTRLNDTAHLDY